MITGKQWPDPQSTSHGLKPSHECCVGMVLSKVPPLVCWCSMARLSFAPYGIWSDLERSACLAVSGQHTPHWKSGSTYAAKIRWPYTTTLGIISLSKQSVWPLVFLPSGGMFVAGRLVLLTHRYNHHHLAPN